MLQKASSGSFSDWNVISYGRPTPLPLPSLAVRFRPPAITHRLLFRSVSLRTSNVCGGCMPHEHPKFRQHAIVLTCWVRFDETFCCRYDITPTQATRLFDMLDPLGRGKIAKGDLLKHCLPLIQGVECFGPAKNGLGERRGSAFKASAFLLCAHRHSNLKESRIERSVLAAGRGCNATSFISSNRVSSSRYTTQMSLLSDDFLWLSYRTYRYTLELHKTKNTRFR